MKLRDEAAGEAEESLTFSWGAGKGGLPPGRHDSASTRG